MTDWLSRSILAGSQVIVPAIVYYELKRELLRASKTVGLRRLDAFVNAKPGRYLPLSDPKALDIDVIIAAQSLSSGTAPSDLVVATTNPKHLLQFVTAKHWSEIVA